MGCSNSKKMKSKDCRAGKCQAIVILLITEGGTQLRNSPLMCCNIKWFSDAVVSTPVFFKYHRRCFMGGGVFKCQDLTYAVGTLRYIQMHTG